MKHINTVTKANYIDDAKVGLGEVFEQIFSVIGNILEQVTAFLVKE